MTTGSATISVTNTGVATVENVAPLNPQFAFITAEGVVYLHWWKLDANSAFISSLDLVFMPDASGTTNISNDDERVMTYPNQLESTKAKMYVTGDGNVFDTETAVNGHPGGQADCTVITTRTATGGITGSVDCSGTFFNPRVQSHRTFTATATFWAEP